ncbi:translation elongation factor Ts [Cohaesibacter gelatinilyticus]|uniref:Elongation factor Ts n=1 Tax=Cohaesibacter gelatinilyticus TaxID=372072 RepID=A0A285NEE4_9HYPH|nr:translation elongation factor Ts [Cohaesibacter gelatinilyticus]SNZ07872.1 translation elongation factor Ts (EF-Ts) [Cohaesibacter gelatinilyticus]
MAITASMVKELRETSGAGMMDCKKALTENDGNMEAAIDWLRTKGLSKAAKKSDRVAAEGLIALSGAGNKAAMVEVNAETDFVSRNEQFQDLARNIAGVAIEAGSDAEAILAANYPGGASVAETITNAVATIGENMNLRRGVVLSVEKGSVASYVHNATAAGLGRLGVLVALESDGDAAALDALGKQIAMHVAATNPLAATVDEIDAATVEREKAVFSEQARESGKPDNIIEKMVEGRLRKFYEEVVLLKQTFVIDGENTVEQAIKNAEGSVGAPIKLAGFARFALGEGIEKKEEDFAAEVAAASGQA